ncbi:MAG: anhydro-N-acetylmuramic acid kinase [Sulfuricella sp.]|nr:anhydro-N-acetylmuramic acid kinase [Sulfuricella sp.]
MSGTSLDGVDAVLVDLGENIELLNSVHHPLKANLRNALLLLNTPGNNELDRSAQAAIQLSQSYAEAVYQLLKPFPSIAPAAIGCHGQTVRHRPEFGYTIQLSNPALLAELTSISVVADFRSRDIAAGGQGAPLVPAFHAALFRHPSIHRVIVNIGGISNLTDLPTSGNIKGFDCGPGNVLLDSWIGAIEGKLYDDDGQWGQKGKLIPELLERLLAEPYFSAPPPKSTGRDLFNLAWLHTFRPHDHRPEDVQATLVELTARGIADAIATYCRGAQEIYLCGGGARNGALANRLKALLPNTAWRLTDDLGLPTDCVEACAFAWLAQQTLVKKAGNLPDVTGAKGSRILGAIYPA